MAAAVARLNAFVHVLDRLPDIGCQRPTICRIRRSFSRASYARASPKGSASKTRQSDAANVSLPFESGTAFFFERASTVSTRTTGSRIESISDACTCTRTIVTPPLSDISLMSGFICVGVEHIRPTTGRKQERRSERYNRTSATKVQSSAHNISLHYRATLGTELIGVCANVTCPRVFEQGNRR